METLKLNIEGLMLLRFVEKNMKKYKVRKVQNNGKYLEETISHKFINHVKIQLNEQKNNSELSTMLDLCLNENLYTKD